MTGNDVARCIARIILDNYEKFKTIYEHEAGSVEVWVQVELFDLLRRMGYTPYRECPYYYGQQARADLIFWSDRFWRYIYVELKLNRKEDRTADYERDIDRILQNLSNGCSGYAILISDSLIDSGGITTYYVNYDNPYYPQANIGDVPAANFGNYDQTKNPGNFYIIVFEKHNR